MSEFLQKLIPSGNRLEASFASRKNHGTKAKLLQDQYDAGFVGAFVDDKSQDWPARAARYMKDDFMANTPGTKKLFSDVSSMLANGDGERLITCRHALELWEASGRKGVKPFATSQDVGSCVDASASEHMTAIFGWRAIQSQFREAYLHPAAWYWYADRGYCSDGWGGSGIAAVARRRGCAFRTKYQIGSNSVDFTDDDKNENIVARTWCRSGIPEWLYSHTQANHAFEDGAITSFDGGLAELKKGLAAGGVAHAGGVRTSGGSKPFTTGRTGAHMQSTCGYDDTDEYRQWLKDKHNITLAANDFALINMQTWGSGWSGETADQYWPTHLWGPKPEGAWVAKASWWISDIEYIWLPWVKGFPGTGPTPAPINPPIGGHLFAETAGNGAIAIRGELEIAVDASLKPGTYKYIVVPDPTAPGKYRYVQKPTL